MLGGFLISLMSGMGRLMYSVLGINTGKAIGVLRLSQSMPLDSVKRVVVSFVPSTVCHQNLMLTRLIKIKTAVIRNKWLQVTYATSHIFINTAATANLFMLNV